MDPRYELLGLPDPSAQQEAARFYGSLPDTSFLQARGMIPQQQQAPEGWDYGVPQPGAGYVDPFAQQQLANPMAAMRQHEDSILQGMRNLDQTSPGYQSDLQQYFADHPDPYAPQYPRVAGAINAGLATHKELQSYLQKSPRALTAYREFLKAGVAPGEAMNRIRAAVPVEPADPLDREDFYSALSKDSNLDPLQYRNNLDMKSMILGHPMGGEDILASVTNPDTGMVDLDEARRFRTFSQRESDNRWQKTPEGSAAFKKLLSIQSGNSSPDALHAFLQKEAGATKPRSLDEEWENYSADNPKGGLSRDQFIAKKQTDDAMAIKSKVRSIAKTMQGTLRVPQSQVYEAVSALGIDPEEIDIERPQFKSEKFKPKESAAASAPAVPAPVVPAPAAAPEPVLSFGERAAQEQKKAATDAAKSEQAANDASKDSLRKILQTKLGKDYPSYIASIAKGESHNANEGFETPILTPYSQKALEDAGIDPNKPLSPTREGGAGKKTAQQLLDELAKEEAQKLGVKSGSPETAPVVIPKDGLETSKGRITRR